MTKVKEGRRTFWDHSSTQKAPLRWRIMEKFSSNCSVYYDKNKKCWVREIRKVFGYYKTIPNPGFSKNGIFPATIVVFIPYPGEAVDYSQIIS